ncbi:MAG: LacI family DNA-binding transcriptional regulator [Microbacterium sp.]
MTQQRRATRKDVARLAGTSVALVSYVVNGGPRAVAPETRERILRAIERTGYRPDPTARTLASGVSGVLGIIVPDISNTFFANLAHAIDEAAHQRGKRLLLGDSAEGAGREAELVEDFIQRRVDGLLYVGVERQERLEAAYEAGIPVVILDRLPDDSPASSVVVDNRAAAREATEHLLAHGHTSIGLVSGPGGISTTLDRAAGWRDALVASGIRTCDEWQTSAPFTKTGGLAAGRTLFRRESLPRALFVSNDQQAVGLLVAAAEAGVRVPDDLAIFTFDGTPDAEYSVPGLSTVAQPLEDIARRAVELLVTPGTSSGRRVTCEYSLTIRQSCGCGGREPSIRTSPGEPGEHTHDQENHP